MSTKHLAGWKAPRRGGRSRARPAEQTGTHDWDPEPLDIPAASNYLYSPHWQKVDLSPPFHHNYSLILKANIKIPSINFCSICLVALLQTFHILQVRQPTGFNCNAKHFTNQSKESDRHFLMGHLGNANQKSKIPREKMGLSNLPSKLGRGCRASFFSRMACNCLNNEIILSCC